MAQLTFLKTVASAYLVFGLLFSACCLGEEKPVKIQAEAAREHEGKKVVVTFEVKASKDSQKRRTVYLDSEQNFQDKKNLGIAITEQGSQELNQQRGIRTPADHFLNKTIRVTGVVVILEDRVYIEVDEASQIEEVDPSKI